MNTPIEENDLLEKIADAVKAAALEHANGSVVPPALAEGEADADAEVLHEFVEFLAGRWIGAGRFDAVHERHAFSTSASTFVGGWRCGIRFSASAKAFSAAANSDCSSRNPFRRATKSAVTEACPEYVATERRLAERLPLATAVR